ncbi:MAG: hypothetical protein Q9159_007445 [Coniocarpon cinnabarinum]
MNKCLTPGRNTSDDTVSFPNFRQKELRGYDRSPSVTKASRFLVNTRRRPNHREWEAILKPKIEDLYRGKRQTLPEVATCLQHEFGFHITERMIRQRTKQWDCQKSRRESEMIAAAHIWHESIKHGFKPPKMSLRGRIVDGKCLREFFRKKPAGRRFEDMRSISHRPVEVPLSLDIEPAFSATLPKYHNETSLFHGNTTGTVANNVPSLRLSHSMLMLCFQTPGLLGLAPHLVDAFRQSVGNGECLKGGPRTLMSLWCAMTLDGRSNPGCTFVTPEVTIQQVLAESIIAKRPQLLLYLTLQSMLCQCLDFGKLEKGPRPLQVFKDKMISALAFYHHLMLFSTKHAANVHGKGHYLTIVLTLIASSAPEETQWVWRNLMDCIDTGRIPVDREKSQAESDWVCVQTFLNDITTLAESTKSDGLLDVLMQQSFDRFQYHFRP